MITLGYIASIQMGHTFRSSLISWPKGNVPVVQMKDLSDAGVVLTTSLSRIQMDDPNENHLVQTGDLVFRSRGANTKSALVPDYSGTLVLAAPMFRVRINREDLLPAYLNWYINQPKAQSHFVKLAQGSAQMMITKQHLAQLPVEIPSLEAQKKILEITGLLDKERSLRESIAEKREKVVGAKLAQIIGEA